MNRIKRLRRPLALLLIGVAWLFRDHFAAALEKDNQSLQSALAESNNQHQAELQAGDQREMLAILRNIQARLRADEGASVDAERQDAARRSLHDEGGSLKNRAEALEKLAGRISADADTRKEISAAVTAAQGVATKLMSADVVPGEQLFNEWDDADTKLTASYEKLTDLAQSELESSQSGADASRGIAWFFTAVGGLLAGNWRSLLGGADPDREPTAAGEGSSAAAAG